MKKFISLTLCIAVMCSFTLSCGNEAGTDTLSDGTSESETAAETTRETALPEQLDFGNEKIIFLCRENESNSSYINEIGAESDGDVINDAIFQRNRKVEERLKVVIEPVNMNGYWDNRNEFLGRIRNSVSAGDSEYDVVAGYAAYISPIVTEGLLRSLADAPYIDYKRPWWNSTIIDQANIHGKNYFVAGDIGLSCLGSAFVIYYNKRIAEELSLDNLYETVKSGQWTREKAFVYAESAARDLNGDGNMDFDNDCFGFVANQASEYSASFGLRFISNNNGTPILDFDVEKISDALTWLHSFFYENKGVAPLHTVSTSHTISLGIFEEGRSLFYSSHLARIIYLRSMTDDFGVLPLFKWDEQQTSYQTMTHDAISLFCVPVTTEGTHFEATCATMEALAEEGYYSVTPVFYNVALQNKFTRDEESAEMMDMIRSSIQFSVEMIYASNLNNLQNLVNQLVKQQQTNFVSYYESNKTVWQSSLENLVTAVSSLEN